MKKEKDKVVFVGGLLLLVLAVLFVSMVYDSIKNHTNTALTESETEQIVLELTYAYQNPQWSSAIENLVQNFEEKYPNIKVNYKINYESKVYEDILSKKIARNELGDIVQLKTPEAYAKSDTLAEISDEVADLVTSVYAYEGKKYGVGAVEATTGIIYNKKMFKKYHLTEPKTYEEFLEICSVLKAQGIDPVGVGGSDLWHMEYWVNHFFRTDVLSKNANWLSDCEAGNVSWTDAEPEQMMRHLEELFSGGYVDENWLLTSDGSLPYKMSEGEIAMIYTGPWTADIIQKLNEQMELGWFYVPDSEGNVYAGDNKDTYWAVTKSCAEDAEQYEAAMTFLTYFYQEENYSDVCQSTSTFPLTKTNISIENTEIQNQVYHAFGNADERMEAYIGNEDTPEDFEKNMLVLVQGVLSGNDTVSRGLAEIQEAWESCRQREGAR